MKTREEVEAMGDDLRTRETARLCGIPVVNTPSFGLDGKLHDYWSQGYSTDTHFPFPDYLKDLNAMHEAEGVIPVLQRAEYVVALMRVTGGEHFLCYHATARQRNTAFLMTLLAWAHSTSK